MNRLVVGSFRTALSELVRNARQDIWICSPWIKTEPVIRLLQLGDRKKNWKVLARGSIEDFVKEVSDLEAFERLVKVADVRLARNLHAKTFIADEERALVGSANLTSAAETSNLELMVETDDPLIVRGLAQQIDEWFKQSRPIDLDWIAAMRDLLLRFTQDTPPEPMRAPELEGAWIISAQPIQQFAPSTNTPKATLIQIDDPAADSHFLYADWPMPEEWKPVLDMLLPKAGLSLPRRSCPI
ncbi:MAG TPA: phospholipase D family protein [Myxococcaceae bacterium]|jgi:phosphatidylserine/phosphatidylglycerophosphate/cardiolipin synthase-like enzyme